VTEQIATLWLHFYSIDAILFPATNFECETTFKKEKKKKEKKVHDNPSLQIEMTILVNSKSPNIPISNN